MTNETETEAYATLSIFFRIRSRLLRLARSIRSYCSSSCHPAVCTDIAADGDFDVGAGADVGVDTDADADALAGDRHSCFCGSSHYHYSDKAFC
jgi:hypothetical protein